MNPIHLLQQYKDTPLFEMIINLILVKNGDRYACLIETDNFDPDNRDKYTELILSLATNMKLYIIPHKDISYRYFISKEYIDTPKSDEEIATILGFYCIGHEYWNSNIPHIVATIYEITTDKSIIVEVCNLSANMKSLKSNLLSKVHKFNKSMKNTIYRFDYKIHIEYPEQYYIDNVNDIEFVKRNINKYSEIMYNDFYENTIFKQPHEIIDKYPLFLFLFNKVTINKELEDLYNNVKPLSESYYELMNKLSFIEHELQIHDINQYENIWSMLFQL